MSDPEIWNASSSSVSVPVVVFLVKIILCDFRDLCVSQFLPGQCGP